MGYYHVAQICLNGHMITDSSDTYPELCSPYCPKCGAATITACPSCGAPLPGDYDCGIPIIGSQAPVNAYCHQCGKPYPWTESAIESTKQVILEEESITEPVKNAAIETLPDLISETPKTNLAVVRIKKILSSAGKFTSDAVRQFVIDFGCELAVKLFNS